MATLKLPDISKKMRDVDFAVQMTRSDDGSIAGRPMSNNRQVEFDGDSFFFTLEDTNTVRDIRRDACLSVDIGFARNEGFLPHAEGRAKLIRIR